MRVKMKVGMTGTRDGVDWPPAGGCVDLPADEAAHLCAAGLAEPCPEPDVPETATAPAAPRTATRRRK